MLVGVVLTLVGILGLFMDSPLLGLFEVNATHNWIHLLSGVIGVAMAMQGENQARTYAKVFGVIYALVTVLGFAMGGNVLGLFHANGADNLLHLVLAAVLLWAGFAPSRSSNTPVMPPPM